MTDSLLELQRWMQDSLMFPGMVESHKVSELVASGANISAADCLGIYQRSYYSRLLSCLKEQFPATCYALGEEVFNQFCFDYLRHNPSDSYTLYELGRRFTGYLQQTRPDKDTGKELWIEFMIELAEFERIAFNLFDAQGDEGHLLDASCGQIDDEQLQLQQALRLHKAQFPVARYYCLVRDEKQPKLPPLQPSFVALVRVNYTTHLNLLNTWQYQFLAAWQSGNTIDEALQLISERADEDMHKYWPTWKSHWLAQGFFVNGKK